MLTTVSAGHDRTPRSEAISFGASRIHALFTSLVTFGVAAWALGAAIDERLRPGAGVVRRPRAPASYASLAFPRVPSVVAVQPDRTCCDAANGACSDGWNVFTRLFGAFDLVVWCLFFFPLLLARPCLVLAVGLADGGSLALPDPVAYGLGAVLLVPSLYTLWSVQRYFGMLRAAGRGPFPPAVPGHAAGHPGRLREWTPNAMYVLAFLGLWAIAFLTRSHLALAAVAFQHAYIWVHHLCTEQPDMALLHS